MGLARSGLACGILLVVAAGSALGGYGWGFQRGDSYGVAFERERLRSLRTAPSGVEDALEGILAIPDMRTRVEAVIGYVDAHTPDEAAKVNSALREAVHYVDPASFAILVGWWARFDPPAALRALNSNFFSAQRTQLVAMVIQEWARADPEAAREATDLTIALSRPDDIMHDTYRTALAFGWAQSGRKGYWEYVEALPVGTTRQRALAAVATWMVADQGVDATMAFAKELDPGGRHSLKLQFHRRAARAIARRDPRLAAEWALEMFDSPFGEGMLTHVASEWGRVDGKSALEWMENLPPGKQSEEFVHQTYLRWLRDDPLSARSWLEDNAPGSPLLAPAIALYIRSVGPRNPEAAAEWVPHLAQSERYRDRTVLFLVKLWLTMDRERALEWVNEASLDPELREQAISLAKPSRSSAEAESPGA